MKSETDMINDFLKDNEVTKIAAHKKSTLKKTDPLVTSLKKYAKSLVEKGYNQKNCWKYMRAELKKYSKTELSRKTRTKINIYSATIFK